MTGYRDWVQRRRIELAAVVIILGVFVALFVTRVPHYEAAMEDSALQANLSVMRASLSQAVLSDEVQGDTAALRRLAGSNPLDLVGHPPAHYLGARPGMDPARAPAGSWYFDPRRGVLVYRVRSAWAFSSRLGPPPRVEFKIVDPSRAGPRLVSTAPYAFQP